MRDTVFAGYEQPEDYEDLPPRSPLLTALEYSYSEPEPNPADSAPSPPARSPDVDPCDAFLISHLAPNHPELAQFSRDPLASPPESASRRSSDMTDPGREGRFTTGPALAPIVGSSSCEAGESPAPPRRSGSDAHLSAFDAKALGAKAAAAVRESEASSASPDRAVRETSPRTRVDSAQEDPGKGPAGEPPALQLPSPLPGSTPPLRLKTSAPPPPPTPKDTGATSPVFQRHVMSAPGGVPASLPALQTSPSHPRHRDAASPISNRLPSIRQLEATGQLAATGQLDKLAEVATQQDPVLSYARHHSGSFGSTTSASPLSPYYPHTINLQGSPSTISHFPYTARSPTSALSEPHYGSPTFPSPSAYFARRRTSSLLEHAPSGPPSLPSASSTGSNQTHHSSGAESYSTAHTTPSEAPLLIDDHMRPTLPVPAGMLLAGYRCDEPGCNVPPFLTPYLLRSHRNVHSSNRPFYCPVQDCPRSEAGKGFKRKNEMIRHGLVHSSPGYVCPFCPDKEHKYPRPDNLLRHVNVHHRDRDRDDPLLSEVLARRSEGSGKARRRRATGGSIGGGGGGGGGGGVHHGGDGDGGAEGADEDDGRGVLAGSGA